MFVRAYLRASTDDQDANRARQPLQQFANEHGLTVASWYTENESGAKLARPELFRLLNDCQPGDVLLVEQVDRLSRLNEADWLALRREIQSRGVRIVALDLPSSWANAGTMDETTARILGAVNTMLLDLLAAVARKDYTDRRRRQAEGIAKVQADPVKKATLYRGRGENVERNAAIVRMLQNGESWNSIIAATKCSRSTISAMLKRVPYPGAPS
jgi:DNA invertase Pin-like site-specific DNA recombinase